MALDDFIESEVAVAVAATAAALSPRVRHLARRGAVYGVAGVLMAGDAVGSFARGIQRGVQQAGTTTAAAAQDVADTVSPSNNGTVDTAAAADLDADETAPPAILDAEGTPIATPPASRRRRARETDTNE